MTKPMSKIELCIYYAFIFLILYEWLVPVMELTNTGYIQYFMLFILLSIACTLLQLPMPIAALLKVMYILWFITLTHGGVHLLHIDGMRFLASEAFYNAKQLIHLDVAAVTNSVRTILFFVLLWMLMYLIHYWITVRYSLFYFVVMTIFFLASLDTFSDYDGQWAIAKVLLYGLVLTGMLVVKRIIATHDLHVPASYMVLYTIPVFALVATAGYGAYMMPKAPPTWPDPIPFVKSVATGEKSVSKVGYDEDDSTLGGSFESDDTLVFTAQTSEKRYWRIDSRDTYTSKGWTQSYAEPTTKYVNANAYVGTMYNAENVDDVTITMETDDPYVLSPYGTLLYDYDEQFIVQERIESGYRESLYVSDWTTSPMDSYRLQVDEPSYSLEALRQTDMEKYESLGAEFDRYLQLPDTLPQRVRDLAHDITDIVPTAYEKARAIETYFKLNGYTYSTTGVAIPTETEDYVDQFLFETKVGYCDNFSTSMVVLMRSLGIPARWVKGFVTGDAIDNTTYEITNNEAHSWVEVYLVGIGWVPFEPTIGFSGTLDVAYDVEAQDDALDEQLPEQTPQSPEQPQVPEQETSSATSTTASAAAIWNVVKWIGLVLVAVLLIGAAILYKRRNRWLPAYYVKQSHKQPQNWTTFEKNYKNLLKQFEANGYVRGKHETLAAYAKRIDEALQSTEMRTLTSAYECYLYGNSAQEANFAYLQECWEYLINRTSG